MSSYIIRSGDPGVQDERDRTEARLEQTRERREKLGEEAHPDIEPPERFPSMWPEDWQARLPLIEAFIRQGHLWQWFGSARGWCKVTDTDFAAAVEEYSETWRKESPYA